MSNTTDPNAEKHGIVLSERAYDLIKDLDLIALPAVGVAASSALTLYRADAQVTALVVGTITIIITILGILLKISNVQYKADAKVDSVIRANTLASIVDPVITVSPDDPTKVDVVSSAGQAADPVQVEVSGGSQ